MRKLIFILFIVLSSNATFAQQYTGFPTDTIFKIKTDTLATNKKWDIAVDMSSRYIWRGQSWGGNYFVVQPAFNYAVTKKWSVGIWATTNFRWDDYEMDESTPKGYQEFDVGLSYGLTDFLTIQVWDYYWPSLKHSEDVDPNYFNYGPNGVKTVDASLVFDFSDGYQFPFDATVSTLIGGNDYRTSGDTLRRNYTTYIEVGYTFPNLFNAAETSYFNNVELHPAIGAVLNNAAEYYTYASYTEPSFVNLAMTASREFVMRDGVTMPFTLSYTHNAAKMNTEPFGRNFLTAGLSLIY